MLLCSVAATGAGSGCGVIFKPRREKLVCREFDVLEYLAGVIGGGYALLARNAEVICRNKHLHPTLKLHDGKKSKGNKHFSVAGGDKFAVEKPCHTCRKCKLAAIAAIAAVVRKAAAEHDRRNDLHHRPRSIRRSSDGFAGFGIEHFYVAFAAVKDNLF